MLCIGVVECEELSEIVAVMGNVWFLCDGRRGGCKWKRAVCVCVGVEGGREGWERGREGREGGRDGREGGRGGGEGGGGGREGWRGEKEGCVHRRGG